METPRRNLLVVRAGETSVHRGWLRGGRRDFDLLVSYYGTQPGRYRDDADHYHVMAGPRWPAHAEICRSRPDLMARYDHVCFACDDLEAGTATWNRLFALCRQYALDLAQPAIEGFVSYDLTKPRKGCLLRYTNYVENMCPVFSRQTLAALSHTFGDSVSGWGLGAAWWSHLRSAGRMAIIDSVRVRHGRPVRSGTLYTVLADMGVDERAELAAMKQRYGVADHVPMETARVMTPLHRNLRKVFPFAYG